MTKKLIASAALFAAMAGASPALADQGCTGTSSNGAVKLTVVATDLKNSKGEVAFSIYPDSRSKFLASHAYIARARIPTKSPATTACFWLPAGHYAAALYHDENADHDFNRTLFSIKEGFGFSNDAPTTLGLPSFDKVRFALPAAGGTIRVKIRYSR
ncbi:DUF2141 domain-containing protein [Stakelama sp. CBK3Z-3]|uniref:DUF2141 domain-containing protein n=1 Tax=Stakelama flava TaxID=2860338 RepID=A0ABS6XN15_9SPHN|nr:DUF2141 domain-containing protein [Stakelama flava]MBW4331294.1 DUF2141 domain-containing protein [Stakelama flava]